MKTLITIYSSVLKNRILNDEAVKKLASVSEITWVEEGEPYTYEQLCADISEYDACITSWDSPKLTKEALAKARKLKFVGHAAGTVVPYVDECIFDMGIKVVNANSALACSTAELAFSLINAASWNLSRLSSYMKKGVWSSETMPLLPGLFRQKIGIIGYGDISKQVIKFLKPFEPDILMYSNNCPQERVSELGVKLVPLDELLSDCRIISLHNTLTSKTRGMIGKRELGLISDGSVLINTARAPIIDEDALIETLKSGRISAALDVFYQEPMPKEHIFNKLDNVLCVPHVGGYSEYWRKRLVETVADDFLKYVEGAELRGEIDKHKFSRLTLK